MNAPKKIQISKELIGKLALYANKSNAKAIGQLLSSFLPFIFLWFLMYKSLDYSYLITFLLGILNAFFLVRIFIIQHDCGHHSFVQNTKLRKLIGHVCSFFSTIPFKYWAASHAVHHKHNGQLELRDIGDLPTMTALEFKQASQAKRFFYRIYRSPVVLFVLVPIYYMLFNLRLPLIQLQSFKKINKSLWLFNALLIVLFITMLFVFDWSKFLATHLTVLGIFAVIAIWFFYVQHQHEKGYKMPKDKWDYITSALKGSTYYKLPRIFRWLTGNIGLHHLHHLNPAIPNYNLKKCLDENPWLNKHVTTIGFFESLKFATHKLWDEQQERMISFTEFYQLNKLNLI